MILTFTDTSAYGSIKQSEIVGLVFKDEHSLISAGAADRCVESVEVIENNIVNERK
jgi:hypothetical protein